MASDQSSRPSSTRASKKGKGGGDTLKALTKELKTTRARLTDREKKIKSLEQDKKNMQHTIESLESWKRKTNAKMAKEQKIRTGAVSEKQEMRAFLEKTQRAIAARLGLIGIDFRKCNNIREALDAAISAINKLATALEAKEAENKELKEEIEELKKRLAALEAKIEGWKEKLEKQTEIIDSQNKELETQKKELKKLNKENAEQAEEIERLRAQLAQLNDEHTTYKEDSSAEMDKMRARIEELEGEKETNLSEIEELKRLVAELRAQIEELTKDGESKDTNLEELRELLKSRDKELAEKDKLIAKLKKRIAELEAELDKYLNRPTADKETNTILTGDINHQLTDYPRLLKSIVELRNILSYKNDLIAKLQAENKELLIELGILMKKLVAFHPCQTNHSLQVLCMAASPNKYVFATGSDDKTVRLWKVDPDSKNAGKKITVFKHSTIESRVDCVAWNHDGTLLACGTCYRESPDGYVVIWTLEDGNPEKYNAVFAIRSRPTVRFGKVKSISFSSSTNGKHRQDQFIYCGDLTGSIWVFDLDKEHKSAGSGLIGVIQSHTDLVYDMAVTNDGKFLYSVSHDQTMAVFEIIKDFGGEKSAASAKKDGNKNSGGKRNSNKMKKSKSSRKLTKSKSTRSARNLGMGTPTGRKGDPSSVMTAAANAGKVGHGAEDSASIKYSLAEILADESVPKIPHYAGIIISQNDKYPFWKVTVSDNGEFAICASRKIQIMVIKGNPMENSESNETICSGPKISDGDLDHIKSLRFQNGKLAICRKKVDRVKMFDVESGKETKKFQFKKPVQSVEFMGDNAHLVVCLQKVEGATQPPTMKLVKYSNDRKEIAKEKDSDKNLLVLNMGMNPSDGGNSMDFDAQGMSPPTGKGKGGKGKDKRSSKKSPRKKAKKKDKKSPRKEASSPTPDDTNVETTPVETTPVEDENENENENEAVPTVDDDEKGDE